MWYFKYRSVNRHGIILASSYIPIPQTVAPTKEAAKLLFHQEFEKRHGDNVKSVIRGVYFKDYTSSEVCAA